LDPGNNITRLPVTQAKDDLVKSDELLKVPVKIEQQTLNGVKFGEVHIGITPSSFESRNTSICNMEADTSPRNSKLRGS
jgi:hypothetical protein